MHGDAKKTDLAERLIAFERQLEEGIIDPKVKCFVVQSKRAPTTHMTPLVAASVFPNCSIVDTGHPSFLHS